MRRISRYRSILMFSLSSIVILLAGSTTARTWPRGGPAEARDYLTIDDQRPGNELALILWLAPPMIDPQHSDAKKLLGQFVVVATTLATIEPVTGRLKIGPSSQPSALSTDGRPLSLVPPEEWPPALNGALQAVKTAMAQSVGDIGKSISWYVFQPDGVDACKPGSLQVIFAGETYSYKTPVPGCEMKQG